MSFKYGVFGGSTGNSKEHPATNATAYATREEAERAGHELLGRWFGPTDFVVYESEEPINYTFPEGARRPERIENKEAP